MQIGDRSLEMAMEMAMEEARIIGTDTKTERDDAPVASR